MCEPRLDTLSAEMLNRLLARLGIVALVALALGLIVRLT